MSNLVTSKNQKGSEDRVREFHGIRKPKTVDEFRENLVKYFVTIGPQDKGCPAAVPIGEKDATI